jgi:predicted porin
MNRTPLAAALIVLAGAAQAQTPAPSVQIYGLIDMAAGRFGGASAGVNALDKPIYRAEGGGMSTSHLGFRGSEDLGGGLSASFELSTFLRPDGGTHGRSDAIGAPVNVAADPFWSRQSWVGLTSATFGRIRVGNATAPLFLNAILTNAFGDSTVFGPLNLVTFIGSPLTGGTSWTNHVVYDSPNLAGFSASLSRTLSEGQGGHNTGVRAGYAQGPWSASMAWQDVKKNPATFADGTSPNNTTSWQLGGSYNFYDVVRLYAHLGRIQNDGTEAAPLSVSYKIWDVSASLPISAGNLLLGYASRKTSDAVGPVPANVAGGNVERKVFTLGYDYFVSKRTDLYAMVMNDKTVTRSLPAPPQLVSASATNYGIGLRHRF